MRLFPSSTADGGSVELDSEMGRPRPCAHQGDNVTIGRRGSRQGRDSQVLGQAFGHFPNQTVSFDEVVVHRDTALLL